MNHELNIVALLTAGLEKQRKILPFSLFQSEDPTGTVLHTSFLENGKFLILIHKNINFITVTPLITMPNLPH